MHVTTNLTSPILRTQHRLPQPRPTQSDLRHTNLANYGIKKTQLHNGVDTPHILSRHEGVYLVNNGRRCHGRSSNPHGEPFCAGVVDSAADARDEGAQLRQEAMRALQGTSIYTSVERAKGIQPMLIETAAGCSTKGWKAT